MRGTDLQRILAGEIELALNNGTKTRVLQAAFQSLKNSIRVLFREQDVSRSCVQRILHKAKFNTTYPVSLHGLLDDDADRRLQFCEVMLNEFGESGIELFHLE